MIFKNYQIKNTIIIQNEENLQEHVVRFLRKEFPDLLFSANGIEENLNTDSKRIKASKMGYTNGTPDIIIYSKNKQFNGISLELKSPSGFGIISKVQDDFLKKLKKNNYLCLVSNDYTEIVRYLTMYFYDISIN